MEERIKNQQIKEAKGLAKWFSVKIEIRMFGHLIWSYQWPPQQ